MIDLIGAGGSPNLYLPVPVEAGRLSREIALPDEHPAGIHTPGVAGDRRHPWC